MSRRSRMLALVIGLLAPGVAQAAQPQVITIDVLAGTPGYTAWFEAFLPKVRARLEGRYAFRMVSTEGSVANYLGVRERKHAVTLVQEDVAEYSAKNETGKGRDRYPVRAIARVYTEYAFFVAPRTITSLSEVKRLDIGPASSGSSFTYHRMAVTIGEVLTLEPRVLARKNASSTPLEVLAEGDGVQAAFRITNRNSLDLPEESEHHLLSLDAALLDRIVVTSPVYRKERLLVGKQRLETLAVDTLLVGSKELPAEVAEAMIEVIALEHGIEREDLKQPQAPRPVFYKHRLPEHPALIQRKRGRLPYLDMGIACLLAVLLLIAHLYAWRSGTYHERLRPYMRHHGHDPAWLRRQLYLLTVLLSAMTWTIVACLLIKFVEVQPVLDGLVTTDTGLWRMDLRQMLTWLFILVTMGNDQGFFPATATGRLLAVTVQIGSWVGLIYVLGTLATGVVEGIVRRYTRREVPMKLSGHLVICNWKPAAEVILRELRKAKANLPIVLVGEEVESSVTEVFTDVHAVEGSPHNVLTLERARVADCEQVIILRSDDGDRVRSDALVARICLAIRDQIREAQRDPDAVALFAEVADARCGKDMMSLSVRDVGTERSFEVALLAWSAFTPRISHFYDALLHFTEDTVELYSIPAPAWLRARDLTFGAALEQLYLHSLRVDPQNPVILVGVQREGELEPDLNPRSGATPLALEEGDGLDVIAFKRVQGTLDAEPSALPPLELAEEPERSRRARSTRTYMAQSGLRRHVVLCNWNEGGEELLIKMREAREQAESRAPVVIVTNKPIAFRSEDSAFEGVMVIPVDPASPNALDRVNLSEARAVVILADTDRPDPDSHTLLLALRIKKILDDTPNPDGRANVSAEIVDPRQVHYVRSAGVDEPICAREMLYRIFAQAVCNPAIVPIFHDLLQASDETNEVYLVPVPPALENATFEDAARHYARARDEHNPGILLGVKNPDGTLLVSPRGEDKNLRLESGQHHLLVMQYELHTEEVTTG